MNMMDLKDESLTPVLQEEAQLLYKKLENNGYYLEDCIDLAPLIHAIKELKQQRNAIILCHHFMTADLIHGIADVVADASVLIDEAKKTKKSTIIVCAIKPIAEAVKLVNPEATVILPNSNAGCSIADSISPHDVSELKKQYPNAATVAYVNSSAEVKAVSDYVVTSQNVTALIKSLPEQQILFYPDKAVAINVQEAFPNKEIIAWNGKCIVHEEYTKERIEHFKHNHPETHILFHSECDPEIIPLGHMYGGTFAMMEYVKQHPNVKSFFMVTECGLADTMRVEFPDREFIGTCALCPYMKSINMTNTLEALNGQSDCAEIIEIEPDVKGNATKAFKHMYELVDR